MDIDVIGDMNWPAVIVAGVVFWGLGAGWYAERVFGRAWMQAMGWQPAANDRPNASMYLVPLGTCLLSAIAVGMLAEATGTDSIGEGILLGLVVGIGIAAAAIFVTGFFDPVKPKPMTHALINLGYQVAGLAAVGAIIGVWT